MELFLIGAGMGVVGGLLPNPLKMVALTQVAVGRWARAIFVILVPPLLIDGAFLLLTLFFYQFVPLGLVHYVAYLGALVVIGFACHSLWQLRTRTQQEMAESAEYTFAGVTVAALAEVAAPGTWVYWLMIAGPLLGEGRARGYWHVVPFFAGSLIGYYGAAVLATFLLSWGVGLHKKFKQHTILIANILLLLMGISYLVRAYTGHSGHSHAAAPLIQHIQ